MREPEEYEELDFNENPTQGMAWFYGEMDEWESNDDGGDDE